MTLQEAINVANSCLKGGEGISLFYYMDDYLGEEVIEAKRVLSDVIKQDDDYDNS